MSDNYKNSSRGIKLYNFINQLESLQLGASFPTFTYNDKNSKPYKLSELKGKKGTLIIFWASWCGPCRKEIPFLKDFYNKKNSELEFISISIDDNKNDWAKVLNLERMPWKQLVVSNEQEKEAMPILGNTRTWTAQSNEAQLAEPQSEDDDLPF